MRRERGFALLMVLWTLLLLSFLAAVVGSDARTETYLARNLVETARAEALADAGVYRAASGLAKTPREGGYRGDGQIYVWKQGTEEVRFTVRDEGGKIDLNQSSSTLLRELLVVLGVDPKAAAELADAIVDYRDDDDDKSPHGAEARDYADAGLPWRPKNGAFVFSDELIYVRGMTPDIYRRMVPFVTVYGQLDVPHAGTAPTEVAAAVKAASKAPGARSASRAPGRGASSGSGLGGTDPEAGGFGSPRSTSSAFGSRGGGFGSSTSSSGFGSSTSSSGFGSSDQADQNEDARDRSGGSVFAIHAEGRTEAGTVYARDAIVDVAGSEKSPLAFRTWRQGDRVLFPVDTTGRG